MIGSRDPGLHRSLSGTSRNSRGMEIDKRRLLATDASGICFASGADLGTENPLTVESGSFGPSVEVEIGGIEVSGRYQSRPVVYADRAVGPGYEPVQTQAH
jgi:hypothetical protein